MNIITQKMIDELEGKYGAIWTADIMIDKTLKDDVLRFESEKGQILTETLPKVV